MAIDVLLVDDHVVIREAMGRLLDAHPDLRVVGQAGSVAEGTSMVLRGTLTPPGEQTVLLCDVSLPDGSGLTLAQAARTALPRMGIVILTMHEDDRTLLEALDIGASAMVHKSAPAEQVIDAIVAAAAKPTSFTANGLTDALRRARDKPATILTTRESEVLQLIADGGSIAQVGRTLFMSESTVKTHVAKIYGKLGAHNRASAVRAAIKLGLVQSD